MSSSVIFPSSRWFDNSSNTNVLRASYVNGVLDVSNEAIFRTDASLCGNVGINGAVSIANSIGMSGVINQLITVPLQGGYVYQQVATQDATNAINQVNTLNTLVIAGNALAAPSLAPYCNPTTGNVVTLGTSTVNAALGGLNNYVTGNLSVIGDTSLNTRLFLKSDASLNARLFVASDISTNSRLFVGQDASINGLSIGLGALQLATNTGIGRSVLQQMNNASSINNVGVGYQALIAATNPVNNTAVGSMALSSNTTGSNNTALGYGAGAFVSTSSNNTCIGANTGFASANTFVQSTAIGYNAKISTNNQIVLGTAAESTVHPGNVAVGSSSTPAYTLDVTGTGRFTGDVSINGSLVVAGNLSAQQLNNQYIINTTTTNYQLIVSEDISLNGRLYISRDASMGGNLYAAGSMGIGNPAPAYKLDVTGGGRFTNGLNVTGGSVGVGTAAPQFLLDVQGKSQFTQDASFGGNLITSSGSTANTYMNVYGKAVPTSTYGNSVVSPVSINASGGYTWNNNNITWTAAASSYLNSVTLPYTAFIPSSSLTATVAAGVTLGWLSSGQYNGTTGTPTGQYNSGTSFTPIQNATAANSVVSVSGEWLQIQSSVPVILNNFNFVTIAFSIANSASRLPYKFYICGSNDNNAWNPIIYGAWASLPIASGVANLTPTSTYVINGTNSLTSNTSSTNYTPVASTSPDTKLNYITYGNGSNSYTYFRVVVSSIIGSNLGSTASGTTDAVAFLWNPTFSVANQTGPSRTLLYMDASNINQLDVSGSLALVNSNASTMTVIPNTMMATRYTRQNNNITWVASASSYSTNNEFYRAFDTKYNTVFSNLWSTGSATNTSSQAYSATSPFAYIGTGVGNYQVTNNFSTTIQNGVGATAGEWLQIQSNVPLILSGFSFTPNDGSYITSCTPGTFYICGSNDNTTWYPLVRGVFGSVPYLVGSTITLISSPIYNVTTTSQNALTITNTFNSVNNNTTAYIYFRLVVTNVMGTLGGASLYTGTNATSVGLQFNEWTPYFSPATSAVSMALDNGFPNQLNVGGAMNVTGALSLTGAGFNILPSATASTYVSSFLGDNVLFIRSAPDTNHGLCFGSNNTTRYSGIDGPFLFGYGGGVLGTTAGGNKNALTWLSTGNVGIGTTSPAGLLDITASGTNQANVFIRSNSSDSNIWFNNSGTGARNWAIGSGSSSSGGGAGFYIYDGTANAARVIVNSSGYVGIGTTSPSYPLHITQSGPSASGSGGFQNSAAAGSVGGWSIGNFQIYLTGSIRIGDAVGYASDYRIKTNIIDIDDSTILSELIKFKPKTFTYKDTVKKGTNKIYGFIAQDVEAVLPENITHCEEIIPNIYELADVNSNIITLRTKSTIEFTPDPSGNPIEIKCYDCSDNEILCKITRIIDDKRFEIDNPITESVTFVYGQKIKDFKNINKDDIYTLTTAAVKVLIPMVQTQQQTIQTQHTQIQDLQSQLATVLSRLAAAGIA